MIDFTRTTSDNGNYTSLVRLLDADLAERDGADHAFYAPMNKTGQLRHVVVAYEGALAAGCGAMREFETGTMEIKRMFTLPGKRGKGIAGGVLQELERWAAELGYAACVLETGKRQPEAISLYLGKGYLHTDNYGQYAGMENNVCFRKQLG